MRQATVLEGGELYHAAVAAMERAAVLDPHGLLGAKKRVPDLRSESSRPTMVHARLHATQLLAFQYGSWRQG